MEIHVGEIYGKQTTGKFVMYNVLKVTKNVITLQNIDNPLSLFETTAEKLTSSGTGNMDCTIVSYKEPVIRFNFWLNKDKIRAIC